MFCLEDILRLPHTPGLVVLSGCETGPQLGEGRIGLPDAFLGAGAAAVLATTSLVADAPAGDFVSAFYEEGGERDPAGAFKSAIARFAEQGRDEWRAYRLWGAI